MNQFLENKTLDQVNQHGPCLTSLCTIYRSLFRHHDQKLLKQQRNQIFQRVSNYIDNTWKQLSIWEQLSLSVGVYF